jgi:hypothetical protein
MVTIWGWCLVFLIAGPAADRAFDYKTEAIATPRGLRSRHNTPTRLRNPGAVPIPKPEKAAKAKPMKRKPLRSAKRR